MKGFDIVDIGELTTEQRDIVAMVRDFVTREVLPVASKLERADEYPTALVQQMKDLGLFGLTIAEQYGGAGLDLTTYALVQSELSRGWMSLSGVLNTHFMSAWMISTFGTSAQQERWLPRMATGELHSAYSMTEPHAGSDVQNIHTRAVPDGGDYLVTGQKMWATNGLHSSLIVLLTKTDPTAQPAHSGMTAFIVEKQPHVHDQDGLTVPPKLKKLGYKGVETTELVFDAFRVPAANVLGGPDAVGRGFKQFMAGVEVGRVNVAARAVGLTTAALDQALAYAADRETFGRPIAQHQLVQSKLALIATRLQAARLLMLHAARTKDAGGRADLESGMAKLFATETAAWAALEAMRIHGGYGYSQEFLVERLYRDAPLLILGEGTNEIQQLVIARRLLELQARD